MPQRALFLICLISVFALQCIRGAADSVLSGTTSSVLKNGLKVIVREQHGAPLVAIDLWVRAGSGQEGPKESGVAHFIEHLIFKGTPTRKPGEIDGAFEDMGTSLGAGTTRDAAHFFATVPSEYLPQALVVLSDALKNATFDATEMEKERTVILDELARGRNDWRKEMADGLRGALYGSTPYGRSILGEPDSIKQLAREQVISFYKRYYAPNNAAVVLVGDVSASEAVQLVNRSFGAWESGITQVTTQPAPSPQKTALSDVRAGGYGISFPGPSGKETSSVCAADILTIVLADPRSGRLLQALKGLAAIDGIGADFTTLSKQSAFNIYVRPASSDRFESMRQKLETEIQRLRTAPIPEEELDYAKRRLLGGFLFDIETFAGQALMLGVNEMASSYTSALSYFDTVRKLRPNDIQIFAKSFLQPEKEVTIVSFPMAGAHL